MQGPGWPWMSYPQSLQSLLTRFPLHLSDHMAYSTCFAFGVYEELVPYFQGERGFALIYYIGNNFPLEKI